ncbi:putative MFS transporter family protein [Tothia fuscella]|uniref:Autophagy-related protein n=1 Tax=Tothia fuscella TaxID=1048955 RepID=A0A9P4TWT9_9PEZI|nr:putative MFS transporter family protein [Tothia fuscella]
MDSRRRHPHYPGEDTSPTTSHEIKGWYSYGLAAEVFAVCGVGSFLPVTLEQLARERGVWRADGTTPCTTSLPSGVGDDNNQCVIHLFGMDMNTASFSLYTFSLAVMVQALTLVSVSAIADYGDHRKRLLLTFGYTGAACSMLFLLVVPQIYLVAALLTIISITCLGSSFVLLNSFLPLLVANDPSVRAHNDSAQSLPDTRVFSSGHLAGGDLELDDITMAKSLDHTGPEMNLSNQISSKGVGIGYTAAVLVQIFSIGILVLFSKLNLTTSKTLAMRVVLLLVGLWWALFSIPTALWLRKRPGPTLPAMKLSRNPWFHWLAYVKFAWQTLWKTAKVALQLRQVIIFLIAWFLLSDAIATVSGTAILFARTELRMETASVAMVSVTATTSGIAGAMLWPKISKRFNLQSHETILACIFLFEIIPLYGMLPLIPAVKGWGVGGLQRPWEIFPLAVIHGFVMGGLSSYCRSFYGLLLPPGSEAQFYALYAVTDKGSSVIGPAVVGRIVDRTGTIRLAFVFLAVLIVLPVPFIWRIDVEKGRKEALKMANVLKGRRAAHSDRDADWQADMYEEEAGLLIEEEGR